MNLYSPVGKLAFVGPIYQKRLAKLGIYSLNDLLHHLPHRYDDYSKIISVAQARVGETVTLQGTLQSIKNQYTKIGKKIQLAALKDKSGEITVVWFNQPYLVKALAEGDRLSLSGKVQWYLRKPALVSPDFEKIIPGKDSLHTGKLVAVYPETYGISSKWLRSRISQAYEFLSSENRLKDFLPKELLKKHKLLDFKSAIYAVHFPQSLEQAKKARERLAFNELLFIQLKSSKRKAEWNKNKAAYNLKVSQNQIKKFITSLPFKLTPSQLRSVNEILEDMSGNIPMNRLLEGDVGSGKTVVAAAAALVAKQNGYQTVFMAPTQILAQQHFITLKSLLAPFSINLGLMTAAEKISAGAKSDILVGTHSLIHQTTSFANVALVVIDEQQRFGVEQRRHLIKKTGKKSFSPHVLTMTATPIPRTVALTLFGDLDLSTLDEMPAGRKNITTWVVPNQKRQKAYAWIKEKIRSEKTQAFVVCPLIEESESETLQTVRAVRKEYQELKKYFSGLKLGMLHGRQTAKIKNRMVKDFRCGKTNILVSTPVVEVGVDIPNATIMLIEAAERFGLAQIHQLRGRVGRSEKKAYCLLFNGAGSQTAGARLSALQESLSGSELAELDLKLRGPGEVFGFKQHGFSDLKIASWSDYKLVKETKDLAEKIFSHTAKYAAFFDKIKSTPADRS